MQRLHLRIPKQKKIMPNPLLRRVAPTVSALLIAALLVLPAHAVQPQRFIHTTESDFEPGTFEGTAITNLGDLELAATTALLAELPDNATVIYDIIEHQGDTYIAAGPEGMLFKLAGAFDPDAQAKDEDEDQNNQDAEPDEASQAHEDPDTEKEEEEEEEEEETEHPTHTLAQLETFAGEQAFTLAAAEGDFILIGVSGENSRVIAYAPSAPDAAIEIPLPGVRYIWDVLPTGKQSALVATGPDGKIFRIDGQNNDAPTVSLVLDTPQANVLTLAATPDENGNAGFPLYAGTDTDGLIYRLDADGSSAPVYDAAEPEIAAIVVAADGTLYAGTADADQANPGRMDAATEEDTGRPDDQTQDFLDTDDAQDPDDPPLEPAPDPMSNDVDNTTDDADTDTDTTEDADAEQAALQDDDASDNTDATGDEEISDTDTDANADADAEQNADTPPTPEQYDALRDEVRSRLDAARKSGKLSAGGSKSAKKPKPTRPRAPGSPGSPEDSAKEGNAVYRLAPDGIVTEVFRDSVMVLALSLDENNDRLLIATGSQGQLYEVKLTQRETAVLQDLDAEQIVALFPSDATTALILGTANPATLRTLPASAADATGTFTSKPLDTTQVSLWGKLQVALQNDADAVTVQTRTGNVADPDAAAWSPWADAQPVNNNAAGLLTFQLDSPPARFVQYRLTLTNPDTADDQTPVIDRVELAYVIPNLKPAITTFTAVYADAPEDPDEPTPTVVNLEWEAADANDDRLQYAIHARPAGEKGWLTVAEKLDEPAHEWDTRTLPDGRYTLRIVATDRLDNPKGSAKAASRRAAPFLIDNAPPTLIANPDQAPNAPANRILGKATDALSPIAAVEYRVADDAPWRPALPDDLIYDSTTEAFSFIIPHLAPGGHVLTLRVRDTRGNTHHASRFITIP